MFIHFVIIYTLSVIQLFDVAQLLIEGSWSRRRQQNGNKKPSQNSNIKRKPKQWHTQFWV